MHWAPLPHRGTHGIEAWHPQWICMRCHNELPFESVRIPSPTPTCPVCLTPMLWEVDVARNQERWVCSRCPFAHAARPFAPACRVSDLASQQPANPPAQGDEHGLRLHQRLRCSNTQLVLPLPYLCAKAPTRHFMCLCCLTRLACSRHRRSSPGAHALPSASGGLPRSRRCGLALSSPSTSSRKHLSTLLSLSRPRPCKRLQFNVSGPGPEHGLVKSPLCPKCFAR